MQKRHNQRREKDDMDYLQTTDDIFFRSGAPDRASAEAIVRNALVDADDGELFLEMRHSEMLMIDDGRLKALATTSPADLDFAPLPARRMAMRMPAS